jgi:hypothetical protein
MKHLLILLLAASAHAQLLPQTQLEQDLSAIARAANGTTYYGQLLVQSLNAAHAAVWSLPDDRLIAVLNHLGPEAVTGLVSLQSATATALNQSLDAAGDAGPRAVVQPGREFSWEGSSVALVPLEN